MTRDEHTKIIQQMSALITSEHQATATELLAQLSDDYEKTLTENEALQTNNETLTANNEKLRQVNADLFLKVGTSQNNVNTENNNQDDEQAEIKITFDSLFNEKGELI